MMACRVWSSPYSYHRLFGPGPIRLQHLWENVNTCHARDPCTCRQNQFDTSGQNIACSCLGYNFYIYNNRSHYRSSGTPGTLPVCTSARSHTIIIYFPPTLMATAPKYLFTLVSPTAHPSTPPTTCEPSSSHLAHGIIVVPMCKLCCCCIPLQLASMDAGAGPPDLQQLVLMVFFIPATSANTLPALVV